MTSPRRRRSINIDICTVDALKRYANGLGRSPTGAATEILVGQLPPLAPPETRGCGRQGISMSEALWLAVKAYAASEYPDDPYTSIADRILTGGVAPVPEVYIARGEAMARVREEERNRAPKVKKAKDKVNGTKLKERDKAEEVKNERKFDEEQREKSRMKLNRGTPIKDGERRPSQDISFDDEFFGGVKLL